MTDNKMSSSCSFREGSPRGLKRLFGEKSLLDWKFLLTDLFLKKSVALESKNEMSSIRVIPVPVQKGRFRRWANLALFAALLLALLPFGVLESNAQMLSYSTYLDPSARGMAVNSSGEACIKTFFLSKLRSNGSVIYSIPATGAGADLVAIDTQGNCYVTGHGTITPSTTAFQTRTENAGW